MWCIELNKNSSISKYHSWTFSYPAAFVQNTVAYGALWWGITILHPLLWDKPLKLGLDCLKHTFGILSQGLLLASVSIVNITVIMEWGHQFQTAEQYGHRVILKSADSWHSHHSTFCFFFSLSHSLALVCQHKPIGILQGSEAHLCKLRPAAQGNVQ